VAILTCEEYEQLSTGVSLTEGEFDTLSLWADAAIASYLGYMPEKPDDTVKIATALQIALSKQNGGLSYYSTVTNGAQSVSLGDFSYSASTGTTAKQIEQQSSGLFPNVQSMLIRYRRNPAPVKVRL